MRKCFKSLDCEKLRLTGKLGYEIDCCLVITISTSDNYVIKNYLWLLNEVFSSPQSNNKRVCTYCFLMKLFCSCRTLALSSLASLTSLNNYVNISYVRSC